MNNKAKIETLATWLLQQIENTPFGEVGIMLTVHGGEIKKTAKTITEKEQSA